MYKCLLNGQIEKYKEHQKIWKNLITGENNLIGFHYTEKFKEIFGVNDSDLFALPSTKISNIVVHLIILYMMIRGRLKLLIMSGYMIFLFQLILYFTEYYIFFMHLIVFRIHGRNFLKCQV